MTKHEFINGLKSALENELNTASVQEHVNYYNDYINTETRNGRSESDVVAELGDPWIIAKTLLSSEEMNSSNYEEYSYNSSDTTSQNDKNPKVSVFGFDRWWKKLLLILGIIGVVMIVFSIITGLISLISPIIIPFIIISTILRLLKKR